MNCPGPCVDTADSGGVLMARQADLLANRWARARFTDAAAHANCPACRLALSAAAVVTRLGWIALALCSAPGFLMWADSDRPKLGVVPPSVRRPWCRAVGRGG